MSPSSRHDLALLVTVASALSALSAVRCAVVALALRRASKAGAADLPAVAPRTQQEAFDALKQRLQKTSMCRKGGMDPDAIEDVESFEKALTAQAETNPLGTLKDLLSIASFCKDMGSGAPAPAPAP